MQVSIETVSAIGRRLTVNLPAEIVEKEVETRLRKAAKTVRINGFRQGKVPLKVVRQRYGRDIRQEALGEVVNRSFLEALKQEQISPVGPPNIEAKNLTEGENLEYVASFEVYPEVTLADFSDVKVERPIVEINDQDVENMIELLQKQQANWQEREGKAQQGDRVVIDYVGRTKDGEEFEGGTATAQQLELGSGTMIPGFEEGIVDMAPGEERDINVTFPEDYQQESLRGEAVVFTISLKSCEQSELPELDADFFESYGVSEGDEAQFRQEVLVNMQRELKNAVSQKVKTQVMDQLAEKHKIELPSALVADEIVSTRRQMLRQFGGQIEEEAAVKMLPDAMLEDQAKRRVALGLVVGEIIKINQIEVDESRVGAKVEEVASTFQEPEEVKAHYFSNEKLLQGLKSAVLEDQVVEFILDAGQVFEVKATYEDVIKAQPQN
ncbi:MAG: trigger factor [Gammaproteobacteria bacterium]|nr:trigger factor [Gammaproteobacteria bacterium]